METFSLYQLNEYIKRVIALNFKDSIWINAEISQVKLSRGNYYLDLIQKEEDSEVIKAQSSAIIWFRKAAFLEKKFKNLFHSILDTGNEIRVKIKVNFSERYGFSLIIEDMDASYTLGKAEMLKQEILNKLKQEGLLFKNSSLDLPIVLQNIAVISSPTAAGYKDFVSQLQSNSYGYGYNCQLFPAAMQGVAVEKEVIDAIEKIEKVGSFDCIVLIRGGGAKLDLSAFDNYAIGKRIAESGLPVITGIGHDIDSTISDAVSHTDLKTPTAVADFLIEWNLHFESKLTDLGLRIQMTYKDRVQTDLQRLDILLQQIRFAVERIHFAEEKKLQEIKIHLFHNLDLRIKKEQENLKFAEQQVQILSPQNTLKRGFAIVRQEGKIVASKKRISKEKVIETELRDGILISEYKEE